MATIHALHPTFRNNIAMALSTQTPIRVRYADTDQMKMVYYAKFFEYFEQGRSDFLRECGMPYPEIERMGYYLPVIEAFARYAKSARYDDLIVVRTIVQEMPQARIRIEYEVNHSESGDLLATGHTVHSFVNAATGKPTRAPEQFLETLRTAFQKTSRQSKTHVAP
jgi:acyl-CoA thioester hydrolase